MAADDPIGRRRKAERHGRFSEYVAALYLIARGYHILAMRYRTPVGEIDIIARKRDLVAFVEVKARRQEMQAIDAVSAMSQRRIRAASDLWLGWRRDGHRLSQRYDILVIRPWRLPRHFPDAF